MTAGDNANATMQHAAREKPTYANQICTCGTCDVRTAALCTYFARTNAKSKSATAVVARSRLRVFEILLFS